MADVQVQLFQTWLNDTYGSRPEWIELDEDGITGPGTLAGLTKGLQIELGYVGAAIDGVFGRGMLEDAPTVSSSTTDTNLVHLVQGGLWCKGYSGGFTPGDFDTTVQNSINQIATDSGALNSSGNNPFAGKCVPEVWKGLCHTDAYKLVPEGDPRVRQIQQGINGYYHDLGLNASDGVRSSVLTHNLIKALQLESGFTGDDVDGLWGQATESAAPTIGLSDSNQKAVKLVQYGLYLNGFDPGAFDGGFGSGAASKVAAFQTFTCYKGTTGGARCDGITWASLFTASGSHSRGFETIIQTGFILADTSTKLTPTILEAVAEEPGGVVIQAYGRYLTNTPGGALDKKLTVQEVSDIRKENRLVPVFETDGFEASYFTHAQGIADGIAAQDAALALGFPTNTIIYFAVDYDVQEHEIDTNVVNYITGVSTEVDSYQIGIYAPRLVCSRVADRGLTAASYVADLSNGYYGNLGWPLPDNWTFDQFHNITLDLGSAGTLEVDRVIANGNDQGWPAIS